MGNMSLERYWHSCTLVTDCNDNKQVVVVGGSNGNGGETSTEIYDVNSGTWSEGNDFPVGVMNHGATHYQDSFIIVPSPGDIYSYDIVNNGTWTKLSASLTTTCNNGSPCVNPNVVILDSPCPVA